MKASKPAPVPGPPQQQDLLLDIRDLRTWFPIRRGIFSRTIGHVRAVDGVSLYIRRGETVGLVGESGCGKTTLARTLMHLDPARSGSVHFNGQDLLQLQGNALQQIRRRIQMIFQDPFSSLNPRMPVLDIVTEGLIRFGTVKASGRQDAAVRLLQEVGLGPDALHRYPHEFSGGQRQRIGIARALSLRPDLILCDEAVSALDVSVQAQIINLLEDLRERHGLAYLFISHDLSVVRHIAHHTAVMYLGRIVEQGPAGDVMDHPRHPYTRALVSAIPRAGHDFRRRIILPGDVPSPSSPPAGCRFHPRCPYATKECAQRVPRLEPVEGAPGQRVACIHKNEI
jgi:oligopeptide/dipeptide ABC transporter ATP-binding protein